MTPQTITRLSGGYHIDMHTACCPRCSYPGHPDVCTRLTLCPCHVVMDDDE